MGGSCLGVGSYVFRLAASLSASKADVYLFTAISAEAFELLLLTAVSTVCE